MAEFCEDCSVKYGFPIEDTENELCEGCGKIFSIKHKTYVWEVVILFHLLLWLLIYLTS